MTLRVLISGAAVAVATAVEWAVLVVVSVTVADSVEVAAAAVSVAVVTDRGTLRHEQADETRLARKVLGSQVG
jgi:hypothetical protein